MFGWWLASDQRFSTCFVCVCVFFKYFAVVWYFHVGIYYICSDRNMRKPCLNVTLQRSNIEVGRWLTVMHHSIICGATFFDGSISRTLWLARVLWLGGSAYAEQHWTTNPLVGFSKGDFLTYLPKSSSPTNKQTPCKHPTKPVLEKLRTWELVKKPYRKHHGFTTSFIRLFVALP